MKKVITDFTARIDDGDRDYHWLVRPGADVPDDTIDVVYHEYGNDRCVITMSHDVALAVADAITRTVQLNKESNA